MAQKTKKKLIRVWAIVSALVLILLTVATVLTQFVMQDVLASLLGRDVAVYAEGVTPLYTTEYTNKDEVYQAANKLNERICEEGFVLLKNEGNALPLASGSRITVFGKNSVNLAYGGSGSSGGDKSAAIDLYTSLQNAGFAVNPAMKPFYEDDKRSGARRSENSTNLDDGNTVFYSIGETPQRLYTKEITDTYKDYNDTALVVLTRIGGEGFDLPRSMKDVEGARQDSDHYLQLDQNETDLLAAVCEAGFKKVVVLINSGSPMELAFLTHPDYYAYQDKIDAAIWMGFPGASGVNALGRILNGEVNPSGRTVDTYAVNFKNSPVWQNFGDNLITGKDSGDRYLGLENENYYFVDYEENIYVGYRYYETRGADDPEWYAQEVVYPFGYGLSYTTFDWTLESAPENFVLSDVSDKMEVTVRVKNTGSVAGKDVVQLYGHAPYTPGSVEKSEVVLLDFAKTPLLLPGEECTLTLTCDPYYLASYDYTDKNENWDNCFELDAGDYALYVSKNAHDRVFEVPFTVKDDIIISEDPVTGNTIENRYTDLELDSSDYHLQTLLSREDWEGTMPEAPSVDDRTVDEEYLEALQNRDHNNEEADALFDLGLPATSQTDISLVLRDLLTDENGQNQRVSYDDPRWDAILDKLSVEAMVKMCNMGAFKTNELPIIGKPATNDTDGPTGFTNFMDRSGIYWKCCYYCAEVVMASTWNQELMEDIGEMIGAEGLIGADGKGNNLPYSGWYAPGVNIHRSPFGGRDFEYFSEDGLFNGKMAAAEIRGCASKGVYCFVKHFALNEQETHRSSNGSGTWVTEQAMRELYLRPFEIAVKEGHTTAVMSSFNRIGTRWTGGDYRLLTQILRNEWGFQGMVITDFNTTSYMNLRQMAYAGGDLNLGNDMTLPDVIQPNWCDASDPVDMQILRQCVKNILYTVVNSNAMNISVAYYRPAWWKITIYVVDFVAVAVIVFTGIRCFRGKKEEHSAKP